MENTHQHTSFDIPSIDKTSLHTLQQPEAVSPSRLTTYKKGIQTLPQPPALWQAFQRAVSQDVSSQKLGTILQDDPVLSAAILRIANAPGLGVKNPIYDVGRAIAHLGTTLVRTIVSRHSFSGSLGEGKVYNTQKLWKHGMAVSALAEIIADYVPNCNAEEASALGLFHDIGKMSLNLFTEFQLPAKLDTDLGHLVFEFEQFSATHIDLGLLLAQHWELPEKIIQGITFHHHPAFAEPEAIPEDIRVEVFAVYLADVIATHLGFGTGGTGLVLPQDGFAAFLPDTTIADLLNHEKVAKEISRIESITF